MSNCLQNKFNFAFQVIRPLVEVGVSKRKDRSQVLYHTPPLIFKPPINQTLNHYCLITKSPNKFRFPKTKSRLKCPVISGVNAKQRPAENPLSLP